MKKIKIIFLLILIQNLLFGFDINGINALNTMDNKSSDKKEDLVIYKDMLNYMKNSDNADQLMVLGTLLITGTNIPDSTGEIIKADPIEGESYLIKSAKLGNIRAYSILGGLYFMNENMKPLDKNYELAEKYLKLGFESGDTETGVLLSNLYIEKESYEKGISLLFDLANKKDSNAQLGLAILFKNGLYNSKGEAILNKNMDSANQYLNLACNNSVKSEKIKNFCFDSKNINFNKK